MKQKHLPYDKMLVLLGTISVFLCYLHAFPMAINIPVFLVLAVVLFLLIQRLVSKDQQNMTAGAVLVMFILLFLARSQFVTGIQYLYNQMVDVYAASDHYVFDKYLLDDANYSLQSTLCVLTIFVCYVLVLSTTLKHHRGYFLDFVLSLSLFIPTIMYRVPQSFLIDALLFSFWVLLFISHTLSKTGASHYMGKGSIKKLFLIVFLMTYGLLCVSPQFAYQENVWIENTRIKIQSWYRDLIHRAVADETGEVDLRNAADRYYLGTEEMTIKASQVKEYYIKTFSASIYQDQKWNMLDEYVYEQERILWEAVYHWYDYTHPLLGDEVDVNTIIIEDKRALQNYAPVPYDLAAFMGDFPIYYDAYVSGGEASYHYEQWRLPQEDVTSFTPFQQYLNFAQRRYHDIPNNITTLFDQLDFATRDRTYTSEEATRIIRSYLNEQTTYTLRPGATPSDQDFVYYFLTENKKGYCVHYATTATLMFRYMGIPARYVEGYHVSEKSFDKDGVASVSDRQAHAWVEILDEERGWIPVEVTASAENQQTTQRPNQNDDNDTQDSDTETNTPDDTENNPSQNTPDDTSTPAQTTKINLDLHLDIVLPIAGMAVIGIGILLMHKRRCHAWISAMTQKDRKKALIHCDRYLEEWKHFGATLSKRDHELLDKALYSTHPMSEEEYQEVYGHLRKEVETCFQKLTLRKKLYVIFWKAIK